MFFIFDADVEGLRRTSRRRICINTISIIGALQTTLLSLADDLPVSISCRRSL